MNKLQNQEYPKYVQPDNENLFSIVLEHVPEILRSQSVLDYGCNTGRLLKQSNGQLDEIRYTGIDSNLASIDLARTQFTKATFHHINYYNCAFSNTNRLKELPIIETKFDVVVCYGVLMHCTIEDVQKILDFCTSKTKKVLIFSLWEKFQIPLYRRFLSTAYGVKVDKPLTDTDYAVYLTNRRSWINSNSFKEQNLSWFESFVENNFIERRYPNAVRLISKKSKQLHSIFKIEL